VSGAGFEEIFNFFEPLGAPLTKKFEHFSTPFSVHSIKKLLPETTSLMWDGN
jgi:hypothetical protein